MVTRQTIHEKRETIIELAARHGAFDVRLFGSLARGEATETSDVDIVVRLEPGRTLFDQGALLMDLRDLLGVDVDLVSEGTLQGRFGQIVRDEAVAI